MNKTRSNQGLLSAFECLLWVLRLAIFDLEEAASICDCNRSEYIDSDDQLVCFLANSLSSMEFTRTITRAIFASL